MIDRAAACCFRLPESVAALPADGGLLARAGEFQRDGGRTGGTSDPRERKQGVLGGRQQRVRETPQAARAGSEANEEVCGCVAAAAVSSVLSVLSLSQLRTPGDSFK